MSLLTLALIHNTTKANDLSFRYSMLVKDDSTINKNKLLKSIKTNGFVSLGYDYGAIPFANINKFPSGFFRTEGNVGISIKNIPVNANFYYTTLKNITGLNNYFRVSFDAAKYKENIAQKITKPYSYVQDSINAINGKIKELNNKIGYFSYMNNKVQSYQNQFTQLNNLSNTGFNQFSDINKKFTDQTSINLYLDSLKLNNQYYTEHQSSLDSLRDFLYMVNDFKTQYKLESFNPQDYTKSLNTYNTQLNSAQNKVDSLKNLQNTMMDSLKNAIPTTGYKERGIKQLLKNTKKLEVGLCYPNYSTFLMSGIAIRGINYEYETKSIFAAASFGKTINNMFFTNNLIENTVIKTRNPFNYFDFNNPTTGRNLAAIKFGIGKSTGNHIHFGVLYGIGPNSLYVTSTTEQTQTSKEKNYVIELDSRLDVKSSYIQLVFGKSYLQNDWIETGGFKTAMTRLFDANLRSNALMLKTVVPIKKIKNNMSFTFRLVDPFFKSYGVGFMRSDNIRYEFKSEQSLFKTKIKLGGFVRYEQDNFLKLLNYTNVIRTIGINTTIRIKKNVNLKVDYSPLVQTTRFDNITIDRNSSITNLIITLLPGNNKIKSSLSLMGSFFNLKSETGTSKFYTTNISLLTNISKRISNNFYAGWFYSLNKDTLQNTIGNSYIINDEIRIQCSKNINVAANGKYSANDLLGEQWGYGLKANFKLSKNFALDIAADKIVAGDFYNSYPVQLIKQFPYYCSTKLIIQW